MSCNDFVISAYGRQGIGVVQPQSGLDFPFIAPSEDIQYLFADFYLAYDDPGYYEQHNGAPAFQHPLRVEWVYGIGCDDSVGSESSESTAHSADIRVVDANDNVVFNSVGAQTFTRRNWGDDYEIIEWIERGTETNVVCRAVIYKTWASAFEPKNFPRSFYPESAVLDERAVYKMPKRVRSIRVRVGSATLGQRIKEGGGRFSAGYNMSLTTAAPQINNTRQNTNITFTATPGLGFGQYSDCDDDPNPPITSINGVPGNNGDFLVAGEACIYMRRPTVIVPGATIADLTEVLPGFMGESGAKYEIGSNCQACCDCADYVETATYMNRIRNRYKTIGRRAHEVKLLHGDNIERWIEARNCRLEKPLKLIMVPQCCPNLDVVIMFCNQCQTCAENVRLEVNFASFPSGALADVRCGYTQLHAPGINGEKYAIRGAWPSFYADLPPVDVGNSAYVKFRLLFEPKQPLTITGTLTATKNGMPILAGCEETGLPQAQTIVTKTLNCDLLGNNIETC